MSDDIPTTISGAVMTEPLETQAHHLRTASPPTSCASCRMWMPADGTKPEWIPCPEHDSAALRARVKELERALQSVVYAHHKPHSEKAFGAWKNAETVLAGSYKGGGT